MAVKLYGPVAGPGVQVREIPGQEGALGAPVGSTFLVGLCDAGPVGEVVRLGDATEADKVFGRIGASQQPTSLGLHIPLFYEGAKLPSGRTAGTLYVLRLAADDAEKAWLPVFSRHASRSILEKNPTAYYAEPAWILEAGTPGPGPGKGYRRVVAVAGVAAALTSPEVFESGILGEPRDRFLGGVLSFPEIDPSWSASIRSYDPDTGYMDLNGQANAAILAVSGAGRAQIAIDPINVFFNVEQAISLEFGDGDTSTTFTLSAVTNPGGHADTWRALSLDETTGSEWGQVLDQPRQWTLTPPGSPDVALLPADPLSRPCNLAEIVTRVVGRRIYLQTARWTRTPARANAAFLDTRYDWTHPAAPRALRIKLTFNAATTFLVSVEDLAGNVLATGADLPSGTLGTAWTSPVDWIPSFTARAGIVAAVAADVLEITYRPIPADFTARKGRLYVAAAPSEQPSGDVAPYLFATSHGPDWIEVATTGLDEVLEPPIAPEIEASTNGPFDVSGTPKTFIFTPPGGAPITLTLSITGAAETTSAVAADLNAQELARAGSANAKVIEFAATVGNGHVVARLLQDFGSEAVLTLGSGTLNAIVGFTNGATAAGTDGKIVRLQVPELLQGGHNGDTPQDPTALFVGGLAADGPLRELEEANTGLITYGAPEIPIAAVQNALAQAAERTGGDALVETPPNVQTSEADAIAWFDANLVGGSWEDHRWATFPSRIRISPPLQPRITVEVSGTGLVLGMLARIAVLEGYAQAPANAPRALLNPTVKALPTGERPLDSELLTSHGGMNELRKRGPQVFLYGDRIRTQNTQADGTKRGFLHVRRAVGHLIRVCQVALQPVVFGRTNAAGLARGKSLARQAFLPYWRAGWFDDSSGPAFEDQVSIVSDFSNNTAADRAAGNQQIAVSFAIVGTAERVVVTMNPNGIAVSFE